MTPGARAAAAIELLEMITESRTPADVAMGNYFRQRKYIGSKDRGEVAEMVYLVLRRRAELDWHSQRSLGKPNTQDPSSRARIIAALAIARGETEEEIAARFDGEGYAPRELSFQETQRVHGLVLGRDQIDAMPLAERLNIPAWAEPILRDVFGDDLPQAMQAMAAPAALDLRVNTLKGTRQEAMRALSDAAIFADYTTYSPVGLRVAKRTPVFNLPAFREGLIEVQDEGSQLAGIWLDAKPGERVADFCAGAGGKTLAMAAAMNNRGRLYAFDVSERRLEELTKRLRRGGVSNATVTPIASEVDPVLKRHKESMDKVLVDAPCSGTGTWRRNPDAKWRLTPAELPEYAALQQRILTAAAKLVRPGGVIGYITCSVLRQENEEVVEAFLAANPQFHTMPAGEIIKGALPPGITETGPYIRLAPHTTGTDGFFACYLWREEKVKESVV